MDRRIAFKERLLAEFHEKTKNMRILNRVFAFQLLSQCIDDVVGRAQIQAETAAAIPRRNAEVDVLIERLANASAEISTLKDRIRTLEAESGTGIISKIHPQPSNELITCDIGEYYL